MFRRYSWAARSLAALITLASFALPALAQNNNGSRADVAAPGLTLGFTTRGVVFKTAAINSDGSVANCFRCKGVTTLHLSTGQYQIAFDENVQATNGWSRWVQPDTLTTGSENVWCNTADRAGNVNAIYVNCQTTGGSGSMGNSVPADASFFLFVAR